MFAAWAILSDLGRFGAIWGDLGRFGAILSAGHIYFFKLSKFEGLLSSPTEACFQFYELRVGHRVARFFMVQDTKTGGKYTKCIK
jgi:hypothetical protein